MSYWLEVLGWWLAFSVVGTVVWAFVVSRVKRWHPPDVVTLDDHRFMIVADGLCVCGHSLWQHEPDNLCRMCEAIGEPPCSYRAADKANQPEGKEP